MNNIFTFEWLRAAAIRAIKTVAQTALGMITIGSAASEIDWRYVVSVSLVAGVYSILTSLAGLPEVLGPNGYIDYTDYYDSSEDEKDYKDNTFKND